MRSVRDIANLEGVRVLVRTSLNVPVQNGKVVHTFRLHAALPTIEYLQKRHAKVILVSHITGTGTETLYPMYEALKASLSRLSFCKVSVGQEAKTAIDDMVPGDVVLLENLRRNKGEETNDLAFAKELACLADIFVQDSFDVCHRKHASVVSLPTLLPSYAGFTVNTEVEELSKALSPKHPALAVIGGAKFATKEPVLKALLKKYDHVFVGGALANDFIHAKGIGVGTSLVSREGQESMKLLMKNKRLFVPVDAIVAPHAAAREQGRSIALKEIARDEAILDAGPHTSAALAELAVRAKTVLWNGPLGLFEHGFMDATQSLAHAIVSGNAYSIVGGGDTVEALEQLGMGSEFSFVSTGGGAMLDFLAYGTLPGLEALGR